MGGMERDEHFAIGKLLVTITTELVVPRSGMALGIFVLLKVAKAPGAPS